jgi:hypothetical protein
MAAPRKEIEISIAATDVIELEAIARSRTEWACRVQRARILLAYRTNRSTYAVGEVIGVTHQTVYSLRVFGQAGSTGKVLG